MHYVWLFNMQIHFTTAVMFAIIHSVLRVKKKKEKMKKDFSFRKESVLIFYQKLGEGGVIHPFFISVPVLPNDHSHHRVFNANLYYSLNISLSKVVYLNKKLSLIDKG